MEYRALRVIISGGGTGGHIFPAVSIADRLKEVNPDTEILFVGAEGKMEMEKVPAAGYQIVGLPVVGLQRQLSLKNLLNDLAAPFKLLGSLRQAGKILDGFGPDLVVGVGGYASAPLLWKAQRKKIPTLLQEQNGFAGLTNKILAKKAGVICVAYEGMEKFFPADKIVLTGNPIRKEIRPATPEVRREAMEFYQLDPAKKHILVVGGSLGSGTLNKAMRRWITDGCPGGENVQVLWQCGKYYKAGVDAFMAEHPGLENIQYSDFIRRMDYAYAAADVVISRSGASSVSEICAAGKAAVFVPSPNVAEDHQTHNAMALVRREAALLVKDAEAEEKLMRTALALVCDGGRVAKVEKNAAAMALTDAAKDIVDEAYKLLNYKNVYFIGIGGIGMSAIARYYKFRGYEVSGYDRTPSALTRALESEGIAVHYEDDPGQVPKDVKKTLVVYTPAIPAEMHELRYVMNHGYRVLKRSKMLGEIAEGQKCLAVAGTHGKTTTSTLLAHILTESGAGCSAFLGGISKNYGTNLLVSMTPTVVAEADEYDRSFHQLHPAIAVITAMDADHLDIYGDLEHVVEAFKIFASQVSGSLVHKLGLDIGPNDTMADLYSYHIDNPAADFHAENLRMDLFGHYTFDLVNPLGKPVKDIRVGTLGRFNVENSVAAAAAALLHGVAPEAVRKAIGSFQGAERRLDEHVSKPGLTYIDDYAHHPQELATAIAAIRDMFPKRRITAVFQPHLYTRTRDFAPEFAQALSGVDKLILLDIYPAREEPIPGVTSEIIFKDVTAPEKLMMKKAELLDYLAAEPLDVLVTFGAGDIDRLVGPITEMLEKR